MKTSELLKEIEQAFNEKLEEKTSWVRNEIKAGYQSVVNCVLAQIADTVIKDQ